MSRTTTPSYARARRAAAVAVAVAALVAGLNGCDDEPSEGATDDPTTAAPSSTSSSPTEEPTATEAAPSVTPAAGLELVEETSAVRTPEGWEAAEPLVDWASGANGPGSYDTIQLSDRPSLAASTDLDALAQAAIDTLAKGAEAERLPDVDLAGNPAYVIAYTEPGIAAQSWDIATIRNGHSVSIDISLDKATADPQVVASVLASFRWLD